MGDSDAFDAADYSTEWSPKLATNWTAKFTADSATSKSAEFTTV